MKSSALLAAILGTVLAAPADFNNLCAACTLSGYNYCSSDGTCSDSITGGCTGLYYNTNNPCDTDQYCDVGVNGVIFLDGNTDSNGRINVSEEGSLDFTADHSDLCYIAMVNHQHREKVTFELTGDNVNATLASLAYPSEMQFEGQSNAFNLTKGEDLMLLYVGALNLENEVATLKWAPV